MTSRAVALAAAVGLVVAGTGVAGAAPDEDRIDRRVVQRVLDEMVRTGAQGVQVRIADGRREFTARAGTAEADSPEPVPVDGRFRIASITKTFVATVVLQLVDERRLELDAPVARYLPGLLAHGDGVTVRHLLQHTSGVPDYLAWLPDDAGTRPFTPGELVALIADEPLDFAPGTASGYSNTNYVLAGMLVERITGRPYGDAVTARILRPLGLRSTSLPGTRTQIPGPHARAYLRFDDQALDVTEYDPSFSWAAGEMISTTADLNRFLDALLDGRLVRPARLREMLTAVEGSGLGVSFYELSCGIPVWGHNGRILGYSSTVASSRDTGTRMTFAVSWAWDFGSVTGRQALMEEVFC
ncbi:serine hydrolase domain-containing protein [Actinosynnema sp. NPDC047251]|nr:serine hydrolase domain-containing protein [Saccharothrix espanaensis]